MHTRTIGRREVGSIAYGGAYLSLPEPVDRHQAIRTVHAALDVGIRLLDTAWAYVPSGVEGHNEALIAEAVRSWSGPRGEVLIGTKGGHYRSGGDWPKDARPEAIRAHCEGSLRALETETIDLYTLHWPDPAVPWPEQVGTMRDLRDEGKVVMVGLSNIDVEQLDEARTIVEISAVQNQFSPMRTSSLPVLEACAAAGIAFTPYSPLGGPSRAGSLGDELTAFAEVAASRGVSVQQVVLAWLLSLSATVIPICGARRPETITDSAGAADLELTDEDLRRLGDPREPIPAGRQDA